MRKTAIISLLFFAVALTSCKKFLDQQPISGLSTDKFWRTPEDAALGNAAIYDGLQKTLSGNYTDWGDARSDNFTYGGTGENQINVTLNGLNSLNGAALWDDLYYTIGRANVAIQNLPRVTGLSEIARKNYLAQAYGIRAFLYFYAIRVWNDVPVRLVPYENIDESPNVPRTPADSVLNNIILPDLNKAYDLVDKTATNVWELNAGGILAMLTDVYMWKKDYASALDASDRLLKLPYKYAISANTEESWRNIFLNPQTTKEAIWSLHWDYIHDGGNGISRIGSGGNTSNYYIDSTVFLRFEENKNDIRRAVTYDTAVVNANERVIQISKFYPVVINPANGRRVLPINAQNEAKLPLYRTAGILLLRAEALNWTNDKTGAFAIVNNIRTLRKATPLKPSDYATQKDVEKAILDERQMELFAEGKRWFDLVRTGRVIDVMDPLIRKRQIGLNITPTGFDDPRKILWPISRAALTRNPLLVQNPPYSE